MQARPLPARWQRRWWRQWVPRRLPPLQLRLTGPARHSALRPAPSGSSPAAHTQRALLTEQGPHRCSQQTSRARQRSCRPSPPEADHRGVRSPRPHRRAPRPPRAVQPRQVGQLRARAQSPQCRAQRQRAPTLQWAGGSPCQPIALRARPRRCRAAGAGVAVLAHAETPADVAVQRRCGRPPPRAACRGQPVTWPARCAR
jgi:hypothetical protein